MFEKIFSEITEWWDWPSVRTERPAEFAAHTECGDYFISLDVKADYRHFFLHFSIRNSFFSTAEVATFAASHFP